jgi:hypothetical protein
MESTVNITVKEYKALLLMSAKAAMIKDLVRKNKYVSTDDIKTILDIEETEGETDGKL